MNTIKAIEIAAKFLTDKDIDFVNTGAIGEELDGKLEVIFPVPEILDPDVACIDPPDVRIWADLDSQKVTWIPQM